LNRNSKASSSSSVSHSLLLDILGMVSLGLAWVFLFCSLPEIGLRLVGDVATVLVPSVPSIAGEGVVSMTTVRGKKS